MTAPNLVHLEGRRSLASTSLPLAHTSAVRTSSRPRSAPGTTKPRDDGARLDASVSCVFCHEPIELCSFTADHGTAYSASCTNCGLLVSVSGPVWDVWARTPAATRDDRSLAERLRARRVAIAARAILERVAASGYGV
jgi:hypothetical protein